MREPPSAYDLFKTDRVLSQEIILDGKDPAGIPDVVPTSGARRISASGKASITLYPPQTDLSRFDRLSLTLENTSPTTLLVGVTLIHGSQTDLPDSSGTSFSGGRETLVSGAPVVLSFPRESFGIYGHPRGWSDIRAIRLTFGRERTYEGPDEIHVIFHRLEGAIRAVPQGPRLTPQGLAEVLNRDVPGVTEFFGSSLRRASGPSPSAERKELGCYSPGDSGSRIPPPHPFPRNGADEILWGRIMGHNIGYPVPWDANPVGELEWNHFLHRHHFLRDLVDAAAPTGDPRYVTALDRTIVDWIERNPVPLNSNGGAGPSWETLSAAWRLREWFRIIGTVWYLPGFRKETRLAMVCSIWEHAQHLLDHRGHPNNWLIVESAALALAGMCFPEFKASETWVESGLDRLRAELGLQFFDDGVLYEISPLYHAICVHALLEVKQTAAETGRELFREFDALLSKSVEYLAALRRPDFTWPSLNDSGGCTGDYTALMTKAGELLGQEELLWIGSRGRVGAEPRELSHLFRDAGIVTMRSHNGPDAHFLVFRAGPPGGFHHHEDALSLDISAEGHPVLVDPGITGYAPGALTDYYRSAGAHNMILIDGKGPLRGGMAFRDKVRPTGESVSWSSEPPLEIATGFCSGPWEGAAGVAALLRTVIFVRPSYWIVRDVVLGSGCHEVTACRQFFPGTVDIDPTSYAARFVGSGRTCLELMPLPGLHEVSVETATGQVDPPMGWVSLNGSDVPAPACRYRVSASLPITLVWGIFPSSGGFGNPIEATRRDGPQAEVNLEILIPKHGRHFLTLVPPTITRTGEVRGPLHGIISLQRASARAPVL